MSGNKEKKTPKFTKRQFLKNANIPPVERDVLRALMKENETYTIDQANNLVKQFAQRMVI